MAASPLPRWAPTPIPTRPLWRWVTGEAPDATHGGSARRTFPFSTIFAWSRLPVPRPEAAATTIPTVPADQAIGRYRAGFDGVEADRSWDDPGVILTWEDLSVTVANSKGPPVMLLHGLSGYARPGEMLAVIGPSGCGKTTLLDALAGRLGPGMKEDGEILINGRRQKLAFGTSAYVTQDNVLMPTLTMREAVYYSAQLQLPEGIPLSEKRAHAERTIREMGLSAAIDTMIGGRTSKGISGGQRKRMSICIEMLTQPRLLFLDEPTSGLDSAASYHVMSHITRLAQKEAMTVISAIHQPSGDVFELFHGLCLLAYGKTVYFGPASDATEFFASNGFPCPPLRNPSDHFLRTINRDFDEEIVGNSKATRAKAAEAIEILVNSYKSSNCLENSRKVIAETRETDGAPFKKRGQAKFSTKLFVLTRRSFVNMHRDLGYYWLRLAIYLGIGLCLGTVFRNVGYSYASIQARCSVLMYTVALLTFMAIGGFPSFVEDMKVFRRERLSGHYGVAEFVISNTLSATPYLALIALLPGAVLYYLTGLQRGIDHFTYYVIVLCICTMLVEGLMMIVAALVPDFLMGIIVGAGLQGVMMLNGGFFRLPNELPKPVWKYPCYYISFHKYAVQGLYKNEFLGLTFPSDPMLGGHSDVSGAKIVRELQVEMGYSKWVNIAILCGMVVLYKFLFFAIVKITEEVKPLIQGLRLRKTIQSPSG